MLPGDMLLLHSLLVSISHSLKYWLHLESCESGRALENFDICETKWVKNDVERMLIKEIPFVSSSPSCYCACSTFGYSSKKNGASHDNNSSAYFKTVCFYIQSELACDYFFYNTFKLKNPQFLWVSRK